jgi:hypothetical protein
MLGPQVLLQNLLARDRDRLRGATGTHLTFLSPNLQLDTWCFIVTLSYVAVAFFHSHIRVLEQEKVFFVVANEESIRVLVVCIYVWGAHTGRQVAAALPLPSLTQLVTSDPGCEVPPRFLGRTTRRPHLGSRPFHWSVLYNRAFLMFQSIYLYGFNLKFVIHG